MNDTIAQYVALSKQWREQWPNHCQTCHGQGVITGYDGVPVPFGIGNCLMESNEACDDCLGQGKCPRCGKPIMVCDDADYTAFNDWYDTEDVCPNCGWNWGKSDSDYDPGLDAPDPYDGMDYDDYQAQANYLAQRGYPMQNYEITNLQLALNHWIDRSRAHIHETSGNFNRDLKRLQREIDMVSVILHIPLQDVKEWILDDDI